MKKWSWGKYKHVILSVSLFIVLDTGVLILNYYTSFQISNDAHAIQLADRQGMLAEQVLQRLYQVRDDVSAGDAAPKSVDELGVPFKQFDEVLDSFIYGSELIGAGLGQDQLLSKGNYTEVDAESLQQAGEIWQRYRSLIGTVVYSSFDDDMTAEDLIEATNRAITYGRENGDQLVTAVLTFAEAVKESAQNKAYLLRMFQVVGISLAVINFFIILFHFIRKLGTSDRAAAQARQETDEILGTVNDGLFLLDKKFRIGSQYSASLVTLFQSSNLAGTDFFQLLSGMVSQKVQDTAREFVEVLFSNHVNADLMGDLNPLEQVELTLMQSDGQVATRTVSFNFTPVREQGELLHLLVVVDDISEQVELRRELEQIRQENSREADLLLSAIHVQATRLQELLGSASHSIDSINTILQGRGVKEKDLREKVDGIFRIVHRLKGEAAAIDLSILESRAHQIEDILENLRERDRLSGDDFLPVTVALNQLSRDLTALQTLSERLGNTPGQPSSGDHIDQLPAELTRIAQQAATQGNKSVALDFNQFNSDLLPGEHREELRAELIQLVRNAVVHGIEDKALRKSLGKSERGTVALITETNEQGTVVRVRDDGAGINLNAIRKRLLDSGKWQKEQLAELSPSQLVRHLFNPGFSTANTSNRLAGRGVGLDYVKKQLESRGGSLSVRAKRGSYAEFCMTMPAEAT